MELSNKDTEAAGEWDLQRVDQFRQGMATAAGSGVETNFDTQSTRGLGLMTLFGGVHLLLAPFPWQLRAGSVRMALTVPEMVVWWYMFFALVLPGLKHAIRHRFGDVMPLLLFLLLLSGVYSLTFGNVGTAYRQRGAVDALPLDLRGDRAGAVEAAPDVAGEPGSRINRDRGGP